MLKLKYYKNSIKKIHYDGCVEYENEAFAYFLVETESIHEHNMDRTESLLKLLNRISDRYEIDVYVENEKDKASKGRYSGIELKGKGQASGFFTDLIEYNVKNLEEVPLHVPLAYAVKAKGSDAKTMKSTIAVYIDEMGKAVYPIFKIADGATVEKILRINAKVGRELHELKQSKLDNCEDNMEERGFMVHLE